MASERQIEANRRNGQKGGPKTEAGKLRSRENAIRHGHCATTIQLIPGEDPAEWEAIRESIVEHSNAATGAERVVLEQMALHHFRTIRIHRSENRMLTVQQDIHIKEGQQTAPHKDPKAFEADRAGALAVSLMITPDNQWTNYLRYEAAISRDFNRSVNQFVSLQNMRLRHERATGMPLVEPTPAPEPEHAEPLVLAAGASLAAQGPTHTLLIPRDPNSQTCSDGRLIPRDSDSQTCFGGRLIPRDSDSQTCFGGRLIPRDPNSQTCSDRQVSENGIRSVSSPSTATESGSVPQNSTATPLNPASAPPDLPSPDLPTFRPSALPIYNPVAPNNSDPTCNLPSSTT